MQYQKIVDKLSLHLTNKRMKHSIGVSHTAACLAKRFGVDEAKAALAGVIHDCARELSFEDLINQSFKNNITVDAVERNEPVLLHAPLGAVLAEKHYGIYDGEILDAISHHTVGGPNMSKLAKIIYLADFIEPGRVYPGVDALRKIAEIDLNQAILAAYDHTLKYIIERHGLIHPATVEGRNEILRMLSK